jgi:hypothetical protein
MLNFSFLDLEGIVLAVTGIGRVAVGQGVDRQDVDTAGLEVSAYGIKRILLPSKSWLPP